MDGGGAGAAPSFSALPHAVVFDGRLSHGARLLYAVLQAHWWRDGECREGHATLASALGVGERTLRSYVRELLSAGYVGERRRGPGQAKAYAPVDLVTDEASADAPGGDGPEVDEGLPRGDGGEVTSLAEAETTRPDPADPSPAHDGDRPAGAKPAGSRSDAGPDPRVA